MITFENTEVDGFRAAFRGMRNAFNSWHLSDSKVEDGKFIPGPQDLYLAAKLAQAGDTHGKLTRMITVSVDITAPFYLWKEISTYKVGTVANSCSTMHTLLKRDFKLSDFSTDGSALSVNALTPIVDTLNDLRDRWEWHETRAIPEVEKANEIWRTIVQMLPMSYNQRRTWLGNYMVLSHIYKDRNHHRLSEWQTMREWIECLPYFKDIYINQPKQPNR